jgi:hypothetical protein
MKNAGKSLWLYTKPSQTSLRRVNGLCSFQEIVSFKYTDKKENKIFLIYKEIQKGVVAKSYITNGLLIYD